MRRAAARLPGAWSAALLVALGMVLAGGLAVAQPGAGGPATPLVAAGPPGPSAAPAAPSALAPSTAGDWLDCPADKELCVKADRSGGIDLKTGVAHLEGNVQGLMRSRELTFRSDSLMAFRDGTQEWVRLVLDHNVRVRQGQRESDSDHGVVEREEVRLRGHVRIEHEQLHIEANEALILNRGARTIVHGTPEAPLFLLLRQNLVKSGGAPPPAQAGEPGTPAPTGTTEVHAQKAVVEDNPKRVVLTGNVHVEQEDRLLRMDAQELTLLFTPQSDLESFRAQGNVVIVQPDRRIAADYAQSRNALRTILLVGNASMQQQGAFDVKSDRMEVYADSSKGVLQSQDRQKPITLSLDLGGGQTYGLTQDGMLALSGKGVPPPVLDKLAPLIGKTYPSRAAFREAASGRLTGPEATAYLDVILANARGSARPGKAKP